MGRLDGRIAFVTGGARGIGRATARKFAAEGATVIFADLDEAAGRETAAELAAAGLPVSFSHVDVTVEADVQRAIGDVVARHGTLDIQPLRRMAEPEEIANLVAFVASDEASAITGASLAADCGLGVMFAT
jgi:NAD(P)-dependent dehydrogenase (short-subunit alcohol dehydrogenase family)